MAVAQRLPGVMLVLMTCLRIHVDETLSSGVDGSATGKPRSRRLRPSVAKCVPREADRGDGVDAEQRSLGSRGNDSGRRASPGPLSGQRKPRPRLSPWVGTASSCTKLPGACRSRSSRWLGPARRQQRPTDRADAFAPCGTPSDLVDGRSELYERCGRRTRHAASKRCGSARWRARTRRVRA